MVAMLHSHVPRAYSSYDDRIVGHEEPRVCCHTSANIALLWRRHRAYKLAPRPEVSEDLCCECIELSEIRHRCVTLARKCVCCLDCATCQCQQNVSSCGWQVFCLRIAVFSSVHAEARRLCSTRVGTLVLLRLLCSFFLARCTHEPQ
jgi:hypothetical protein